MVDIQSEILDTAHFTPMIWILVQIFLIDGHGLCIWFGLLSLLLLIVLNFFS